MDTITLISITWVALLWTTVAVAIHRWGPGRSDHSLQCPEKKQRAQLVVLNSEGHFGELRPADVLWCSLFGAEPVRCDRACLARL